MSASPKVLDKTRWNFMISIDEDRRDMFIKFDEARAKSGKSRSEFFARLVEIALKDKKIMKQLKG